MARPPSSVRFHPPAAGIVGMAPTDFDDAGFAGGLRRHERAEAALSSHRADTGVAIRAVRPYDPRNAFAPARPRLSPVRPETLPPQEEGEGGPAG